MQVLPCQGSLQLLLWMAFTFAHLWLLALHPCNVQPPPPFPRPKEREKTCFLVMQVLQVLRGPEGPGTTRQVKPYVSTLLYFTFCYSYVSEQSLHCALWLVRTILLLVFLWLLQHVKPPMWRRTIMLVCL